MQLLDDIVDILSSKDGSLTDALIKTKVLLHKIGHKELTEWVNYELNGYPDDDSVPSYRVLGAQVLASLMSPAYSAPSHPIPLSHLSDQQRENLETMRMKQSLAVIERFEKKGEGGENGSIVTPIPMEFNGLLGQQLASGFQVQRAWCEVPITELSSILIQVRSRLLDFLLELQDKIPGDLDDEQTKQQVDKIDAPGLFSHAIFGDNATILVGSHNVQTVTNTIVKGDFETLADALRSQQVPEEDIVDLKTAIDSDALVIDEEKKQLGPKVKEWLQTMLGKAVDASWQIELGLASHFLAKALEYYYGWPL